MNPLLTVSGLSVEFRTDTQIVRAVRDVSFVVGRGERVALVGESGSGKTTTALALMQMIEPASAVKGKALLDGVDLLSLRGEEARLARLARVAYVPQGAMNSLNPVLTVARQIIDGIVDHGIRLSRSQAEDRVAAALTSVGLEPNVARMYPHQLSGGMKQRVCLAIGTILNPPLIIADEPTSALDVISQKQIIEMLVETQTRLGSGLIIIGHDMGLMAQVAHRVVVMKSGRIVEDAAVDKIFAQPEHSYSRLLIQSAPSLDGPRSRVQAEPAVRDDRQLLSLSNVTKMFRDGEGKHKTALEELSLTLSGDQPRIISVVGQSGSGKTTLARLILGLELPSSGAVEVCERDTQHIHGRDRLAFHHDVQAIFQDPYGSFNPFYSVDRALIDPALRLGVVEDRSKLQPLLNEACNAVGLAPKDVLGRFPHELSGGQRQRLMVARALLLRPRLIVADEPVSMVDASLRIAILSSLADMKARYGISILYITHDLATAYNISDYVLVLYRGRVVEAGPPERVIDQPAHPYTRSLVDAVPLPDPRRRWLGHVQPHGDWAAVASQIVPAAGILVESGARPTHHSANAA